MNGNNMKMVMTYFDVLYQHQSGWTKETHLKHQPRKQLCGPRFTLATYQIQVRSFITKEYQPMLLFIPFVLWEHVYRA